METSAAISRGPGRPQTREAIDYIAAQVWAVVARLRAGADSFYALDKLIWPDRFRRHRKDEENWSVTPCRFANYARGEAYPNEETQERVEAKLKGCRQWLRLALYEILRPGITRERLHEVMRGLRPGVAQRIFHPARGRDGGYGDIQPVYQTTIRALHRENDIDSMTACFGLALEGRFTNQEYLTHHAVCAAYGMFLGYVTIPPWDFMRYMLFDYLWPRFWRSLNPYTCEPLQIDETRFERQFHGRAELVDRMEEAGLLEHDCDRHRACIYVADQMGIAEILNTLEQLPLQNRYREAKANPLLKRFSRRVARMRLFRDPLLQSTFEGFPASDCFRYKVHLIPVSQAKAGYSHLPSFRVQSDDHLNGQEVYMVPVGPPSVIRPPLGTGTLKGVRSYLPPK